MLIRCDPWLISWCPQQKLQFKTSQAICGMQWAAVIVATTSQNYYCYALQELTKCETHLPQCVFMNSQITTRLALTAAAALACGFVYLLRTSRRARLQSSWGTQGRSHPQILWPAGTKSWGGSWDWGNSQTRRWHISLMWTNITSSTWRSSLAKATLMPSFYQGHPRAQRCWLPSAHLGPRLMQIPTDALQIWLERVVWAGLWTRGWSLGMLGWGAGPKRGDKNWWDKTRTGASWGAEETREHS